MARRRTTPYDDLDTVLGVLVAGVRQALGGTFIGAYLQGSFAVGDFDEHSDVDFVVVMNEELSDSQVEALQVLHARVYDLESEWAKHLEGSYFPAAVLRDATRRGTPLWYLDHGSRSLVRSDHCNTIVVRQVVRETGVTLAGPDPATLVDPIPVAVLRDEIRATMLGWGREILANPDPWANRFYQGYIVLNYARMLHDLVVGRPGSKRAGAEWAKETFGPQWADLIDGAWGARPNPAVSVRAPADRQAFARTLDFLSLVLAEAERA
jgi:aminoglycoside adenylyltransferase-like protein/nucleotidyltransferase-like protein